MKRKFTVQVVRFYYATDTIEVDANSEDEAHDKAVEISHNKDYTGELQFDRVVTEIDSENRTFVVKDIEYDTDGEEVDLPETLTIIVPEDIEDEDIEQYLSDEISNETGFCHYGFTIEGEE